MNTTDEFINITEEAGNIKDYLFEDVECEFSDSDFFSNSVKGKLTGFYHKVSGMSRFEVDNDIIYYYCRTKNPDYKKVIKCYSIWCYFYNTKSDNNCRNYSNSKALARCEAYQRLHKGD